MAGIYIYQQIVKTTAEWEVETTVYPANVWLFEQLENGMFNMAISDGINTYSNLKKVMTEVGVSVKANTETEYILTITTALGSFDTPNLKGPQGERGIQGIQGEKGEQGLQGIQGIQGEKGDKGDKGDQGEQGVQGIQGEKGEQGIQGVQGIQGETGLTGQGVSYRWNGTSLQLATIAAGTDVEQWGESVNLKGEKGDQGEQGVQGEQGIQGIQGEKGDKGDKGDVGTVGVYLDTKPTEDTLTYTENETVHDFALGMSAIYPDSESEDGLGISFFKGLTSENKAVWGAGGGGTVSLNETVIISLISNQDEVDVPDADLIGKSIHVIYGDQDKELVWQGKTVKTTVPINMEYQVVFPTNDKYTCPETQTYRAIAGENREVNGYYFTEKVIINVSCDDDSSVDNQKLTINDTVYNLDLSGVFIIKFPFNMEYSISVDIREGYTAPDSVTFTANSKERIISMQYTFLDYGVYIEATDHTLYKYTQWNGTKTANCIVVKHPTNSFRISFFHSAKRIYTGSSTIYIENFMEWYSSEEYAKKDMNTEYNNEKMISAYGSSTSLLLGYFDSLYLPDGTTKCLLPALGWWQIAYDNKISIDACISTLNKSAIRTDVWYWSSSLIYNNRYADRYFATQKWLGEVSYFGPGSETPYAIAFAIYN